MLKHIRNVVLCVADKGEGSLSSQRLNTTGERLVGHVALENVYKSLVDTL
ncbi:hypothetical protein SDC9_114693 [bioreactor metagenome]|uniref:Uncharacterized protein n=1 Tax=bioreactor metagenome TaxID=1076179 RepID=A0A645BQS1_9ZZZZ